MVSRVAVGVGAFVTAFLLGFALILRFRPKPALKLVRQFNKRVLNPLMLLRAGGRGWYAGTVEHVGRRSGRTYLTPVVVEPTPDGFIIPLPYGADVDWLRNVLAAGHCVIHYKGIITASGEPEVVDCTVALPLVPARVGRTWQLFGITRFLKLKQLTPAVEPTTSS
jgi:hypothetical protein